MGRQKVFGEDEQYIDLDRSCVLVQKMIKFDKIGHIKNFVLDIGRNSS